MGVVRQIDKATGASSGFFFFYRGTVEMSQKFWLSIHLPTAGKCSFIHFLHLETGGGV